MTSFMISPTHCRDKSINLSAVVIPQVTCELPISAVPYSSSWKHLSNIRLADPTFGKSGKIEILLGVDVFVSVLRQGRRYGPTNSPTAIETSFGWVLACSTQLTPRVSNEIVTHHAAIGNVNDILRKFWEVEERIPKDNYLTTEEQIVTDHFKANFNRTEFGSFIVPLPRKLHCKPIGESRSIAIQRFVSLERSLHSKNQFKEFGSVMNEYFELDHAKVVPELDLDKPPANVFYLPMHAVRKEGSTTTKLRVVFDASAKSSSGNSLNDTLLVGPTVHSSLIDVLLRFRLFRVALTSDISKMYRAIHLAEADRDFHRFVWRNDPKEPLLDYRMSRVTFGVSASSYAANMSIKQNALELSGLYPLAAQAVMNNFYVDDCLSGPNSEAEAVRLQKELQLLFKAGGFLLRKWNSSDPIVIEHLSPELREAHPSHLLNEYTKTLGIKWNSTTDQFQLNVSELPPPERVTKRSFVSDVARTFDILGWFSPSIISVKILLQRLWEHGIGWDDDVPSSIRESWRAELKLLSDKRIPRCYFPHQDVVSIELHGFSGASESAYAAVVYLCCTDTEDNVSCSLITSKTKVAPIKRLSIPRLELCGAVILAKLIHNLMDIFSIPSDKVHAWTDSTGVLSWIVGNPRRFKTFVGNRVSEIISLIPPNS